MKTLVLGLGNTILRDDGIGIYAVRELAKRIDGAADVRESASAGLDLVEMLRGYDRVLIVDAIQLEGEEPGTVFRLVPDDLRITARLASLHDVDLVTALALGRRLGFAMPDDVTVYAVQVADALSLGEECTAAVAAALPGLVEELAGAVTGAAGGRVSRALRERKKRDA